MEYIAKLYATQKDTLKDYLNQYFKTLELPKILKNFNQTEWQTIYYNPMDLVDLVSFHQDNIDDFFVSLWICFDPGCFIHVTKENSDELIRYMFERFPY